MQCAARTLDLFKDVGGAGRPDERLGLFVVTVDVTSNRQDEFFEIAKHTAPQSVLSEIAEEALHHVEPGSAGGREVHMKTWVAIQPALNFGVFVGGVVIDDEV